MISADNLGSLLVGGFKESCSALRMCRHCMATKEDTQIKVCCNGLEVRMHGFMCMALL